jgi:hypothetical protein
LGFCVLAGAWWGLSSASALGHTPDTVQATKTGPNSAELDLSAYPDSQICHPDASDPQSGWVSYCQSDVSKNAPTTSYEVPANSLITVVIKNYDSSSKLLNDYFAQVRGTIGGVAIMNGKPMTQLPPDNVAHTFTLQTTPDSDHPLFVSVPLLGVPDNAPNVTVNGVQYPKPNVISFQFHTGASDTYIWHCYIPCGQDRVPPYGFSGPMATTGYMAGRVSVANY